MSFIPTILTKFVKVTIPTVGNVLVGYSVGLYFCGSKANCFDPLKNIYMLRVIESYQEIVTFFLLKFFLVNLKQEFLASLSDSGLLLRGRGMSKFSFYLFLK